MVGYLPELSRQKAGDNAQLPGDTAQDLTGDIISSAPGA